MALHKVDIVVMIERVKIIQDFVPEKITNKNTKVALF